ncbi:MAG: A/G-specific adenine glycosylase [Thiobacillaceae bacterium]
MPRPRYAAGVKNFSTRVIHWQRQHGRHGLPWQADRDPYRIWLSEVMLQQTQVATVIPYFLRFVERFPNLAALAHASEDEVLVLWSGLGYYSRARNLHKAAKLIVADGSGAFPQTPADIERLPGVGRSTAAAIAALAFGSTHAILDGNVKRVLARHGGIEGWPGEKAVEQLLWLLAESLLPQAGIETYTQGMMDLGASICTRSRPACMNCPIATDCIAHQHGRVSVLPTPRPKKTIPQKNIQMLLLMDRGEILLVKRPSSGIWGGLWSFPEIPEECDAATHCHEQLGFTVTQTRSLPGLKHSFTHFHLHISPTLVHIASRPLTVESTGRLWLAKQDALGAALPVPIRKLLSRL